MLATYFPSHISYLIWHKALSSTKLIQPFTLIIHLKQWHGSEQKMQKSIHFRLKHQFVMIRYIYQISSLHRTVVTGVRPFHWREYQFVAWLLQIYKLIYFHKSFDLFKKKCIEMDISYTCTGSLWYMMCLTKTTNKLKTNLSICFNVLTKITPSFNSIYT